MVCAGLCFWAWVCVQSKPKATSEAIHFRVDGLDPPLGGPRAVLVESCEEVAEAAELLLQATDAGVERRVVVGELVLKKHRSKGARGVARPRIAVAVRPDMGSK